jgi:FG-GAP-like repeat
MNNGHCFRRVERISSRMQRGVYSVFFAFLTSWSLFAAQVQHDQRSVNDADGGVVDALSASEWLETGATYTTLTAPAVYTTNNFTHWTSDSYPTNLFRDAWGRSMNPMSFYLVEKTTNTAHYLPSSQDVDGDTVPDWFEKEYFNTLSLNASADTDSDGISLKNEFMGGTHPLYGESSSTGDVFWVDSDLLEINLMGYPKYVVRSIPSGAVNQSGTSAAGTVITTVCNPGGTNFGFWTLDGIPQKDSWGTAYSQISFTMGTSNREAIAYLFVGDTDADGVPDSYEQFYYGTLTNNATSDTDGDGKTLLIEYTNGSLPHIADSSSEGGVYWTDSTLMTINFAGYSRYQIMSSPTGTVNQSEIVRDGTLITTPDMTQSAFAYWSLDGVQQRDEWGVANRQISFVVAGTNREAVAFLVSGDSDEDGVADAYEYYYYGTLLNSAASDTDGDGRTLAQEYETEDLPHIGTSSSLGGVYWSDPASVTVNLQPFERLTHTLTNGVVTGVFSFNPLVVSGWDLGERTTPALGDWDGDGDLDFFVGASGGVIRFYENVGSRTTLDLVERTSSFTGWADRWSGITNPAPALGDWNNDGRADLAIGGNTGSVRVISSTGIFSSTPSSAVEQTIETGSASAIPAFARVVGDASLDLIVLLADGTVRAYGHTGNMTSPYSGASYTENLLGQAVPNATGLAGGDIDKNGLDDVLVSDAVGRIWEFHQKTAGVFTLMSRVWGGTFNGFASGLSLALGDLDGDSDMDAICGLTSGGLVGLRDPRIGIPSGLQAFDGAQSILLRWDPNTHYRLRGYNVYRAYNANGNFSAITPERVKMPTYTDTAVSSGVEYFYFIKGVSGAIYPGNSAEILVETPASETVSAACGKVVLWMSDYNAAPGTIATLKVNANNATGIAGRNLDIRISYDPSVIRPVSQVMSTNTVEQTILTQGLTVSNNAASATGELRITGYAGVVTGEGHLFDILFVVQPGVLNGTITTNSFTLASLETQSGLSVTVDSTAQAILTIKVEYVRGDVDGNGIVNHDDCQALQQIVAHRVTPTAEQLKAGDMDGNRLLDHNDFKLLHDFHLGKPTNPKN